MTTTSTSAPAASARTADERVGYGAVHLDVTSIERSARFWRDAIGLRVLAEGDDRLHLGVPGRELIVLHGGAVRPAGRGHAGLYHVAIHLPDAAEFARVLARLAHLRVPQSPTDHIFSKATYLNDPDGLMLELTLETMERYGSVDLSGGRFVIYDNEGRERGGTEPLDIAEALAPLGDQQLDDPVRAGAFVGHVHLHVPDLAQSYAWYRDVIGFSEHALMTSIGMADLGAGGRFPHRLAVNVWHGPGARQPAPGTAGLRHFELRVPDVAALAAIAGRAGATADDDGVLRILDPAGNRLELAVDAQPAAAAP